MSNFERLTKHPDTGEWEMAIWVDDYLEKHQYGVRFPSEQKGDKSVTWIASKYNFETKDI